MTDARVTQVAAEQWAQATPRAQVTQIAIEQWGLSSAVGTQAAATQVALEEWAQFVTSAPIALSGNIGGYDQYGKLNYGEAAYSWSAIQPALSADLSIWNNFVGNFTPAVSFHSNLSVVAVGSLIGDLAPQVALGGSLTALQSFGGTLTPGVVFAASGLLSGPPWADSEPCPLPLWTESELCLDPGWIPQTGPNDLVYQASVYGVGGYGAGRYGVGGYVPAEPSPWISAELYHG